MLLCRPSPRGSPHRSGSCHEAEELPAEAALLPSEEKGCAASPDCTQKGARLGLVALKCRKNFQLMGIITSLKLKMVKFKPVREHWRPKEAQAVERGVEGFSF